MISNRLVQYNSQGLILTNITNREIKFQNDFHRYFFNRHGFSAFNDFWQLPAVFVDDVNIRRGGWSAASELRLNQGDCQKLYFVKRQENQFRYSMHKPLGSLTYQFEIEAITRNTELELPASNIVSWGFQAEGNKKRAFLVSEAIESCSLDDVKAKNLDWECYLPAIRAAGEKLYAMHQHRIQHGALYPHHMFLDPDTQLFQLIDFERSRVCFTTHAAIANDFRQFLRRAQGIPAEVIELLLKPYQLRYRDLVGKLKSAYYSKNSQGINK